jgi:hypothetical protein
MAGNLLVSIEGLSPNPASGSLTLRVRSESVCDATVRLVSVLGVTVKEYPLHLQPGEHIMTIEDLPSVSGPYEVVLRVNGMDIDRKRIEVLR